MKFEKLLLINAAIAAPMGLACILAPAQLLATYGVTLSPMGLVIYQFWGAYLLGLGMMAWSIRRIEDLEMQRAIASSLVITYGISCVIALKGQFAGANNAGWSTVALFLALTIGFAYLRLAKLRQTVLTKL